MTPRGALSELARLGARLVVQRAVEEEFDVFIGRARYERKPAAAPGTRTGWRPRRLQGGEGEIELELPQLREAAEPFSSKLFPRGMRLLRTEAQGAGRGRVRARALDARRRVALRGGGAGPGLEVDRVADL